MVDRIVYIRNDADDYDEVALQSVPECAAPLVVQSLLSYDEVALQSVHECAAPRVVQSSVQHHVLFSRCCYMPARPLYMHALCISAVYSLHSVDIVSPNMSYYVPEMPGLETGLAAMVSAKLTTAFLYKRIHGLHSL